MTYRERLPTFLLLLPIAVGLLATSIYFWQGGFGGGHGTFDRILFTLALPWCLLPLPESFFKSDILWLIVAPFILNLLLAALLTGWLRRRSKLSPPAAVRPN
jgi:hypothetical protein